MRPDYAESVHYRVLANGARLGYELEAKRSRFVAVLQRVADEAAVTQLVSGLRKEHRDARHFCTAYLLGPRREIQRSNDDGEPAGTAGAPMLEVLSKKSGSTDGAGLSDVCAVVIRYFGGTLLGTGGLIRAYSDAVAGTLEQALTVHRTLMSVHRLTVPHAVAGRYQHELARIGLSIGPVDYAELAGFDILAASDPETTERLEHAVSALDRSTGVESSLRGAGTRWADG